MAHAQYSVQVYGSFDIGPRANFRYSKSRAGLRPSISLPTIVPSGGLKPVPPQPPPQMPFHRLPPLRSKDAPARPPSTCFANAQTLDLLMSPARYTKMRTRNAPLELYALPDPRQDPIALYIKRKLQR